MLRRYYVFAVVACIAVAALAARQTADPPRKASDAESRHLGGEPESIVQVANLVYAGVKSSQCFSDHFLLRAQKESAIATSRRFHAVKLSSEELFNFPLVIMTGGRLTPLRFFVFGLLLGAALATSLKTTLLLFTVVVAGAVTYAFCFPRRSAAGR